MASFPSEIIRNYDASSKTIEHTLSFSILFQELVPRAVAGSLDNLLGIFVVFIPSLPVPPTNPTLGRKAL